VHVATWIEAGTREFRGAECQATARRDPSPVRLARYRPGRARQSGWLGARAPARRDLRANAVVDPVEARALFDSIDTSTVIGLRDRALIGLMVYSFARIGAALGMTVEDVFTQNRRL
jgi:integrase